MREVFLRFSVYYPYLSTGWIVVLSLLYFRRFPKNYGRCAVYGLFCSCEWESAYFPGSSVPLHWEFIREFQSVAYDEPLECVHARRAAFEGSEILIEDELETPDRTLLFGEADQTMDAYGHVFIRWQVSSLLEVPKFCIDSAQSDHLSFELDMDVHHPLETLQAAVTLTPARFDVCGFHTHDKQLYGAMEFTGRQEGELYEVHLFATGGKRKLEVGDQLWGYYCCEIGQTQVEAKGLLGIVEKISGLPVPRLE